MKNRAKGFYWVQYANLSWVVCEWDGVQWHHQGASYPDESFKQIHEIRIEPPKPKDVRNSDGIWTPECLIF
jgi:hypothetical protein